MRHLSLLSISAVIAISTFGCSGSANVLPTSPELGQAPATSLPATADSPNRDLTGGPVGCAGDMLVTNTYPSLNGKDFTTTGLLSLKLCSPREAAISWSDFVSGKTFTTTVAPVAEGVWSGSWNTKVATPLRVTQEMGQVIIKIIDNPGETVVKGGASITTIVTTIGSKGKPGTQRISEQKFSFAGNSN